LFTFCPSCASKKIRFDGKKFFCADCGFTYYHNTAAAAGCVIMTGETAVFPVRGKEPARGKLDLPGGFIDPGEGVLEGLYRELKEELDWQPPVPPGSTLADIFTLFASFPNTYPYKNFVYNTCDMFFVVSAPGLCEHDLRPKAGEIAGFVFARPEDINPNDLAFDSTKKALAAFVGYWRARQY
jgi:8-oxo-dGTP pyrophosphatase MutT (NUDIX family)